MLGSYVTYVWHTARINNEESVKFVFSFVKYTQAFTILIPRDGFLTEDGQLIIPLTD